MLICDVVSIPVYSHLFNMRIVERKEKNHKKNEDVKHEKSFLDEIIFFHNF